MTGNSLSNDVKKFVVMALACFDTPSVVVVGAAKEFGVQLSRQQVERYDPTTRAGAQLSPRWRTLFDETRNGYLASTAGIAISHRSVRLRALQRMYDDVEQSGDPALLLKLLEQAAREVGYQT